jgi:capsular exopolysaccharide synthesis family protein
MIESEAVMGDPQELPVQRVVRLLHLLWRRRLVLASFLAVSLGLGGLYYATAERIFEATAEILVVDAQRESLRTSLVAGRDELTAMATYEKLLASPLVLQQAAALLEPAQKALLGGQDSERVATRIAEALRIRGVRQTNVIELRFRAPQPELTVAVLGAVVQAYARFMEESHKGKAGTLVETLTKEKKLVDAKIQDKQGEYLAIRERVGDLGIKSEGKHAHPLVERAIQLNAALVETQKKRLTLQSTHYALVESMRRGDDLRKSLMAIEETLGKEVFLESMGLGGRDRETRVSLEKQLIEDRAQLETMLEYYGDNHPKVIERRKKIGQVEAYLKQFDGFGDGPVLGEDAAAVARTVEQILRQRLEATSRHEVGLQDGYERAKRESIGFANEIAKLDIVEHDLRWLRELRNTILGQIASIDLRQEHGGVNTTVVREAVVPLSPVSPRLKFAALLSAAAGLAAGAAFVLAIDSLDDRVRSPADLESRFGLRALATIPWLESDTNEAVGEAVTGLEAAHMWQGSSDAASEGFRTLRTVIVMGDGDARRVSLTSSEPSDGKTTVSVNLAIAYQQSGKRVLLIDGDMRKPGLTTLIGARSRQGLAEILASTGPIAEVASSAICRSGEVPIDIIPSGRRPANPGELLLGGRFPDLLGWAETVYDQVIIDSPPVLAGTDAAAIGRVSDATVMVIRPEKNRRNAIRKAVDTLRALGTTLSGAVINAVGLDEQGYGYGYGYGYGHGYGYGYGTPYGEDEEPGGDESDQQAEDSDVAVQMKPTPSRPSDGTSPGARAA